MGGVVPVPLYLNPYKLSLFAHGSSAIKAKGIAALLLLRGPSTALGTAPIRVPGIGIRTAAQRSQSRSPTVALKYHVLASPRTHRQSAPGQVPSLQCVAASTEKYRYSGLTAQHSGQAVQWWYT